MGQSSYQQLLRGSSFKFVQHENQSFLVQRHVVDSRSLHLQLNVFQRVQQISHPNCCKLLDYEYQSNQFKSTIYNRCQHYQERLPRRPPREEFIRISTEIIRALKQFRKVLQIHGDLRFQNICYKNKIVKVSPPFSNKLEDDFLAFAIVLFKMFDCSPTDVYYERAVNWPKIQTVSTQIGNLYGQQFNTFVMGLTDRPSIDWIDSQIVSLTNICRKRERNSSGQRIKKISLSQNTLNFKSMSIQKQSNIQIPQFQQRLSFQHQSIVIQPQKYQLSRHQRAKSNYHHYKQTPSNFVQKNSPRKSIFPQKQSNNMNINQYSSLKSRCNSVLPKQSHWGKSNPFPQFIPQTRQTQKQQFFGYNIRPLVKITPLESIPLKTAQILHQKHSSNSNKMQVVRETGPSKREETVSSVNQIQIQQILKQIDIKIDTKKNQPKRYIKQDSSLYATFNKPVISVQQLLQRPLQRRPSVQHPREKLVPSSQVTRAKPIVHLNSVSLKPQTKRDVLADINLQPALKSKAKLMKQVQQRVSFNRLEQQNQPREVRQVQRKGVEHTPFSLLKGLKGVSATSSLKNSKISQQSQSVTQNAEYVIQKYLDGSGYQGWKVQGLKHGYGKFTTVQGYVYSGQWVDNKRQGSGQMHNPAGSLIYEGEWKADQYNGKGILLFQNKIKKMRQGQIIQPTNLNKAKQFAEKYQGEFEDGMMQGFGRMFFQNGQVFEGGFKLDSIEGQGVLKDGDKEIRCLWKNGMMIKRVY